MKKLFFIAILASLALHFGCNKAEQETVPVTPTEVSDVDITNLGGDPNGGNTPIEDRHSCNIGECHCQVGNTTGLVDITICGETSGITQCNLNAPMACTGNNQTVYAVNFPLDHLVEHFCVYSAKTFSITNNLVGATSFTLQCSGNGSPINVTIPGNSTFWYDLASCAASQCYP